MAPVVSVTDVPRMPRRRPDAHKGDFGHVLVVGGSRGMAGAPALAGVAPLRPGAGTVRVARPHLLVDVVAGFEPSLMTLALESEAGALVESSIERIASHRSTVIARGPGLGREVRSATLVHSVLRFSVKPLVLDADGLNALEGAVEALH